ncbi:MAG: hypothetical protein PWQ40_1660 [Archaeoglobus sp.]|nr:hypothetical protein [Archaeoglobus sp.]
MHFFLLWIICRELLPEIDKRDRVIVVVISSLYPTWIVMVGYSFSHNAFIPFYLLTLWLLIKSVKSGRIYWFILLGVVSGYLYWIHPSGALVIVSLSIVVLYLSYTKKAYFTEFFTFTAIAFFMICLYRMSFEPWIQSIMVFENSGLVYNYPSESEFILGTLKNLGSVEFYWRVLSHISSRILYLTVSSVGIIWFGVYASWKKWSNKNAEDRVVYLFLLLSFVLVLLFSVKVHAGAGNRIDYWLHGRYIEQVLPPILILGFYEFIRNNFNVKSIFIVILATLLGALLVSVNVKSFDLNVPYIQMASFWPVYFLKNQDGIWLWTAVGLIPVVLINVIPASTRRTLGVLIVAIIYRIGSYKLPR